MEVMNTKGLLLLAAIVICAGQAKAQSRKMWASVCNNSQVTTSSSTTYNKDFNKLLVSWRMLPTDTWDTSFLLYRRGTDINSSISRVTSKPVTDATCYQMSAPSADCTFYLLPGDYFEGSLPFIVSDDAEKQALREAALDSLTIGANIYKDKLPYISIPLRSTEDVCAIDTVKYGANDVSVGDLDGDGQMEIVVKRLQCVYNSAGERLSEGTGAGYSHRDCLYAVIWDAYKLDGTFLWRIKGGPGIMLGNSSSFAIADFDGDGRAEMAIRTVEGTVFGDGTEIGDTDGDGRIDYRTWDNYGTDKAGYKDHYNSAGPEFISIIDGLTGRELARDNFIARETSEAWGDGYWKRANSLRVGVGCFDETGLPSVIFGRGVYRRSAIEVWDWRDGQLTKKWRFDTNENKKGRDGKAYSRYAGQGNHALNAADLDGDGLDEIMYGSMAVDHDGVGLWTTELGHGDANHVGKFLPDREGLQMFHCLEGGTTNAALHDAATGAVIWKDTGAEGDCGRCMVADIDPSSPGCEFWWAGSNAFSQNKKDLGYKPGSCNAAIWFDGTLTRQLINANIIESQQYGRTFTMYRYSESFINGTKSNPSWYGDLLGDWREEVIVPDQTRLEDIKIFSTWYPTQYKFPYLMSDHTYMMQCLNQNIGYNQPNHLGYFLGTGMDMSQVPLSETTGIHDINTVPRQRATDHRIYDLSGRLVTMPKAGIYIQNGKKIVLQ